jgi:hypothetical protein
MITSTLISRTRTQPSFWSGTFLTLFLGTVLLLIALNGCSGLDKLSIGDLRNPFPKPEIVEVYVPKTEARNGIVYALVPVQRYQELILALTRWEGYGLSWERLLRALEPEPEPDPPVSVAPPRTFSPRRNPYINPYLNDGLWVSSGLEVYLVGPGDLGVFGPGGVLGR